MAPHRSVCLIDMLWFLRLVMLPELNNAKILHTQKKEDNGLQGFAKKKVITFDVNRTLTHVLSVEQRWQYGTVYSEFLYYAPSILNRTVPCIVFQFNFWSVPYLRTVPCSGGSRKFWWGMIKFMRTNCVWSQDWNFLWLMIFTSRKLVRHFYSSGT